MKIKILPILLLTILFVSCQSNTVPKPRGYLRIDVPEKKYQQLQGDFPFKFEYPVYAEISKYQGKASDESNTGNWINVDFPDYNAHIYLTYKPVNGNLGRLIEDAHEFVYKHVSKADAITQTEYLNPEKNVYGLLFDIQGNTASSVQFYVTDSTSNFLRGALYFNTEPNVDSLAPLISFFRKDVEYLMETLEWND
jgi:gliding motility-associated lipoprotein GldD